MVVMLRYGDVYVDDNVAICDDSATVDGYWYGYVDTGDDTYGDREYA